MLASALVLLSLAASGARGASSDPSKPNWIVMLSDDWGWGSAGYNQPRDLPARALTPNLDEMSRAPSTVRFERWYSGGPVCSPTRTSIFTGRTPNRDCVWTAYVQRLQPANRDTMTQLAKRAGYRTLHAGKWHMGQFTEDYACRDGMLPAIPGSYGVDTWYSALGSGPSATYNCFRVLGLNSTDCAPGAEDWRDTTYNSCPLDYYFQKPGEGSPDAPVLNETKAIDLQVSNGSDPQLIVDRFEAFVGTVGAGEPFMAMLDFHGPHLPHNTIPQWVDFYQKRNASLDPLHVDYYGSISDIDGQVGRVRRMIRSMGKEVADNTVVVFTSDNGCERKQPGNEAIAGRISGCKRWLKRGGINVPGLIEYPAVVKQNRRTTIPAVTMDLLPTFLETVKDTKRENPSWPLDGVSLLGVLNGSLSQRPGEGIGHGTIIAKLPGQEVSDCFPVGGAAAREEDPDAEALSTALNDLRSAPDDSYPDQKQLSWTSSDGELRLWASGDFPVSPSLLRRASQALREPSSRRTAPEILADTLGAPRSNSIMLYNITADPMEAHDLSKERPATAKQLTALIMDWLASTHESAVKETKCISK